MKKKILFVSHREKKCGVHEFGKTVFGVIKSSTEFEFVYEECASMTDLENAIGVHAPIMIIYNYHISTSPWLTEKIVHTKYKPLNKHIKITQVGIMHEVTQQRADAADNFLFDYHIAPDPTLLLKNPLVFKTGRLIPEYKNNFSTPSITTIGSFGFATPNKGFEQIVKAVQEEFDNAIIRFNIPAADFADKEGSLAAKLVNDCQKLITKPGVSLVATHDFLDNSGVLDFLAANTCNIFLYQDTTNRGISSTADYALAVERPLVVSDSLMFRHLHDINPSIVYGVNSIKNIIDNGAAYMNGLKNEWSKPNLLWDYERIAKAIINKEKEKANVVSNTSAFKKFKTQVRKFLGLAPSNPSWLRNTESATEDDLSVDLSKSYQPIAGNAALSLNRILDNEARLLYKPAIDKITELVPLTMSKKIAEANVQQGFVFDTVFKLLKDFNQPKILCVGSYEDTAAMSLKKLGVAIEDIDPVLNYYLQEYYTKPTTIKNSYDIVFSTSVIEHDPDDESFMKCIEGLLAPGGVAVITCDYKDGWKPGDPKPEVDARFYTMKDLTDRLPSYVPACTIVDTPHWECPSPDFNYLGKYQYTFASFVIKKIKA